MSEKRSPYPAVYIESDEALAGHTPARLSDEVFAASNARYILECLDIALINPRKKTMYLAYRTEKPAKGIYWPMGGSRLAGQSTRTAAEGIFTRELGISKEKAAKLAGSRRMKFVRNFEVLWKDRQQAPQDKITHAVAQLYSFAPTKAELKSFKATISAQDFDSTRGIREMSLAELEAAAIEDERLHPGNRSAYRVVIEHWHEIFDWRRKLARAVNEALKVPVRSPKRQLPQNEGRGE